MNQIERRKLLKWATPIIGVVILPVHAVTSSAPPKNSPPSGVKPTTTKPPVTTKAPVTTKPHIDDESKKVLCHQPGTPAEQTIEVPQSAAPGHLGHGDTIGPCED